MQKDTKKYFCTRPKIYSALIQKGFRPIAIVPHYTIPEYHVWVFEDSPELREIVDEYFARIY